LTLGARSSDDALVGPRGEPMGPFEMVLGIVFLSMATGTIHKYLDYRMRMADRQPKSGNRSVLQAVEALRAEMAALKRHETDAILSFDSTLQTLDARVKHLERRALSESDAAHTALGAGEARAPEAARLEVSTAAAREVGAP
jgi:hypothetical protein